MIRKITINDKDYPVALKKIPEPPLTLYVRGKIPKGKCFAIVGTRDYSMYGKRVALDITAELTKAGLIIVSGLAHGIDTFSHQSCLENNGKTIAVLGTGADNASIFPKENLKLANKIIKNNGCLISELAPGKPGFAQNFPRRNRIISGLCMGVLVIEAKKRSGALITANWAKKQNKKLFAVPGDIYKLNSYGPNNLIKQGAIPVGSANDILKQLNIAPELKTQKNIFQNTDESIILNILKQNSLHIEEIIKKTNLSSNKVCSILTILELESKIRNLGGNIYAVKKH